jgi:hypothetical protein
VAVSSSAAAGLCVTIACVLGKLSRLTVWL